MWQSDPLWARLTAMRIGPGEPASVFTARLAGENGWSQAHADAVVEEYRRFLFLIARTRETLTPSDAVDQAWHLHLLHSRHYWEILCARILGRPLHHDPAGTGVREASRHRGQYEATLAHYRAVFGVAPPPAIWPVSGANGRQRPLRIDAGRYWLVPRLPAGRMAALAGGTLLLAACSALAANTGGRQAGDLLVTVLVVIGLIVGLALLCRLLMMGGGGGKGGGGGCSAIGGCGGGDSHGGGHGGGGHGGGGHGCGGHGCGGGH